MASVVRRKGPSRRVASPEKGNNVIQPPDLRQITVISKAEWRRINDEINQVNKEKESTRDAVEQRKALHLKSEEAVKKWSNTLAGQRQKRLEAKKIRDEIEEEKRRLIDKEEAKYQEEKRDEAIQKARTQIFYRCDRVRGLNSALLMTEVLKEREAQIEQKKIIKGASEGVDQSFINMMKTRDDEASRREEETALQMKLKRLNLAQDLKEQIKAKVLAKEQEKTQNMKDGEEIQHLQELYWGEQRAEEERRAQLKRDFKQTLLEDQTTAGLKRASEAQKQAAEEELRKCFVAAKDKMMQLRKEREAELFREAQVRKERIMDKLAVTQREKTGGEEQRLAKAVAERDAKEAQKQREEEEVVAAMRRSIAAHRESVGKEKEQREKMAKQDAREALEAKKEADRIFTEKQQEKSRQTKEEMRKLQDFNAKQLAEKSARQQQQRREQQEFEEEKEECLRQEEVEFHQYSQQIIKEAEDAQQNAFPIYKAAGRGPLPTYLVHDRTGAQMPKCVSAVTQSIKKQNEAEDILEGKTRLGFTW